MKTHKIILSISIIFLLYSCSDKEKKITVIEEDNLELQMIESFEKGYEALDEGDILFAAKKFNEAELLFPQSSWAPRAALLAAYAYYSQDYYGDAIYELQRFIKTYPNHKNISYAHYLLAMCYYETTVGEKKDLAPLLNAQQKFEFIISEYPNTDFALDSSFKIGLILDQLAAKEMYIGRHYIKKKNWIPAINRFKTVIEKYDTTIFTEEALYRLVEIYYKVGLLEESKKYAKLLGYNYQSSKWYENSYSLFDKNYKKKSKKVAQVKKRDKRFLIKKFKSLFLRK